MTPHAWSPPGTSPLPLRSCGAGWRRQACARGQTRLQTCTAWWRRQVRVGPPLAAQPSSCLLPAQLSTRRLPSLALDGTPSQTPARPPSLWGPIMTPCMMAAHTTAPLASSPASVPSRPCCWRCGGAAAARGASCSHAELPALAARPLHAHMPTRRPHTRCRPRWPRAWCRLPRLSVRLPRRGRGSLWTWPTSSTSPRSRSSCWPPRCGWWPSQMRRGSGAGAGWVG